MFSLRTFLFIFVARGRNTAAVDPNALDFLKICIADEIAFDAVRIFRELKSMAFPSYPIRRYAQNQFQGNRLTDSQNRRRHRCFSNLEIQLIHKKHFFKCLSKFLNFGIE
jgi:hypothetical protein